ncbi:putative F-box protein At2g33190 [Lolium rigidum]|uniref:putative F-box protein At2g33190 n=1 Tax=Lolium rigidum TaxID=89674 RepID=UPI001F5D131C|nr:putative F-box protein At2g33190 [Lolium rigidum]
MDPSEPPPLFPRHERRQIESLPRNRPLARCAAGSTPPCLSQSTRVDAFRLPAEPSPELPEDTLITVFGTLEIPDLVRAGAVCTSWRSAYITLREGKHKKSQTPCLLYTCKSAGENVACLYSLMEKRVYRLTLPDPPIRRRFIIGSSLGFLVTVDERSEMLLTNPITGEQIDLPSVTTIEHVKPIHDDRGAVYQYEISDIRNEGFQMPWTSDRCELRNYLHFKAFVFHDTTTGSYIVALIHRPIDLLSFARVGDDKWTWLPPNRNYHDCNYKDGLLYAVTLKGEIHAFDLTGPAITMKIISCLDEEDLGICDVMYIVQAPWGDMLLVSRSRDIVDSELRVLNAAGMKLHKVDASTMRLAEIDGLPDHVLFLGHNHSLCLSAKEYPALKGNHAYFTDDNKAISGCKNIRRDIGVLNLGNNSNDDLVSPQLWSNWPAPVWITPNLTTMKLALPK